MKAYPKKIKKLIRHYASVAYEEELKRELRKLHIHFEEWRDEDISSSQLSDLIYAFTKGPSRELFNKYNSSWLDLAVAQAIANGILDEDELPKELVESLSHAVHFVEQRDE
ncbi:MAG TPA: hypothetical protein VF791_09180 [Pyrinomonadaceae bacterium]